MRSPWSSTGQGSPGTTSDFGRGLRAAENVANIVAHQLKVVSAPPLPRRPKKGAFFIGFLRLLDGRNEAAWAGPLAFVSGFAAAPPGPSWVVQAASFA